MRVAVIEQHKDNGIYSITIYEYGNGMKDYISGATVNTMIEAQDKAIRAGVERENFIII